MWFKQGIKNQALDNYSQVRIPAYHCNYKILKHLSLDCTSFWSRKLSLINTYSEKKTNMNLESHFQHTKKYWKDWVNNNTTSFIHTFISSFDVERFRSKIINLEKQIVFIFIFSKSILKYREYIFKER